MMGSITSYVKFAQSNISSAASNGHTGRSIDCRGFDRVCHVLSIGVLGSTNSVRSSIWESASAAGTYTVISGSLITTIASIGGTAAYCIDVPVNTAKPWQRALTTMTNTAAFGGVAVLYSGTRQLPPTQEKTAKVV